MARRFMRRETRDKCVKRQVRSQICRSSEDTERVRFKRLQIEADNREACAVYQYIRPYILQSLTLLSLSYTAALTGTRMRREHKLQDCWYW
jgi:hypothetical protein